MNNSNEAYNNHLRKIMVSGQEVQARGLSFKEVIGANIVIDMNYPVINRRVKPLGYRFAAAEPLWIIQGGNLLSDINPYGKMSPYSDDGHMMAGAYGPKIVDQIPYIINTLHNDQGSRQAVINIWRERPGPSKDIPCTLSLQFMIREGTIHTVATMRSSDAILGLPYDIVAFTVVTAYIASIYSQVTDHDPLDLGTLTLTMGSAHIYEKDYELVTDILKKLPMPPFADVDFGSLTYLEPLDLIEALHCVVDDDDSSGILDLPAKAWKFMK